MYYLSILYLTQLFIHRLSLLSTYLSISLSVLSIIDQSIYLHYLSSINLPFLSMQPPIIYLSKNLSIQSIMSIYPRIQSSSVYHVYPFVSTTYLSSISIISLRNTIYPFICLYNLPIYMSSTYLYQCMLSTHHVSMCLPLLSVYLYIYPCTYSCGSQLGMTTPLRVCMIRHEDIFWLSELGQGGAPDTSWEETRDVAPHPTIHRTDLPPQQRTTQPLNIRGSKVKTLWTRTLMLS